MNDDTTRLPARFWAKIDRSCEGQGCWEWLGAKLRGYGRFQMLGENRYAHRVAYEALSGPIPSGLSLDHLCRNPSCVNPLHLEPVTQRENVLRGDTFQARNAATTHCPHGHAYDGVNTRVYRGRRHCRRCSRMHSEAYRRRLRAAS